MNQPIRSDKEDRYLLENSKKNPLSPELGNVILSKKRWIILILALLIILISLSFVLFKPASQQVETPQVGQTNNGDDLQYQTLTPAKISRETTQTKPDITLPKKERIEIPGAVADVLADKIMELNDKNQTNDSILIEARSGNTEGSANELPLPKILPNNHFTIQITSSSSFESIMVFVKQQKLANYQIYETRRQQKPWFVLIKGNYPSIEEAKKAVKLLPLNLQKGTPWIKSGEQVNKEKLPQ